MLYFVDRVGLVGCALEFLCRIGLVFGCMSPVDMILKCVCVCVCRRVSVVVGRVVDMHGEALVGVRVSVVTHPLYGFTLTRPPRAQYVSSVY